MSARAKNSRNNRSYNGSLTTVRVQRPNCCITNLALGLRDSRTVIFLVHGQEVPVNGEAFVARCHSCGWTVPKLAELRKFDIERFLVSEAKKLMAISTGEIGDRWNKITDFADAIGLKTELASTIAGN